MTALGRRLTGSVRVRTTVAASVVVMIALAASALLLLTVLERQLTNALDGTAEARANDIAALAAQGPLPRTLTFPGPDDAIVQVRRGDTIVASTASAAGLAAINGPVPAPGRLVLSRVDGAQLNDAGSTFRVVARSAATDHGTLVIYVASNLDTVERPTDTVRNALGLVSPALVLIVAATTWLIVGRALDPVETIRSQVTEISATDLHLRVTEPPGHDEIARLARTMNDLLGRLEAGSERQQQFIADASHELQSPLATIRAEIELALAAGSEPGSAGTHVGWAETGRNVLAEQDRMARLVRNLLVLAKGDQTASQRRPRGLIDLDEVVSAELARLRPRTVHRLDTSAVSAAAIRGAPDELGQLVGNLLDNANRHASSCVMVEVHADEAGEATLVVSDDGPGVPVSARQHIFDRFTRLDVARSGDEGGTGLGLAIVVQIAERHQATITVTDRPGGGARFEVRFPQTMA